MGTHIEMSSAGTIYRRGSTYQPEEIGLPLTVQDLIQLDERLLKAGPEPTKISMNKFAIVPISAFQRAIGNFLKWITSE